MKALSTALFAFVLVVVVSSVLIPAQAVAQEGDQTFVLTQGTVSVPITPLGDGSQSVESFYDYRSPATTPRGGYSSYGTSSLQIDDVSQLFLYRGTEGVSLVFLHDEFGEGGGGTVVTLDISGLPANGEWVVEDDTYPHRDDRFRHSGRSSHIEWLSNGNRTDGGVFRGLGSLPGSITVDMKFNEQSGNYPFGEWAEPPEQNRIDRWIVRSGTGETTELDMNEPVEITSQSTTVDEPTDTNTPTTQTPTTTTDTPTTQTPTTTTDTPTTQTPIIPTDTTTSPTPTTIVSPEPSETPAPPTDTVSITTQTDADGTSRASGPGFGVGIAFFSILVLAVLALVRHSG